MGKFAQVVYMTDNLQMETSDAEASFHVFTAICYALPLLGAYAADHIFGKYAVILYLSGFYCLGKLHTTSLSKHFQNFHWQFLPFWN